MIVVVSQTVTAFLHEVEPVDGLKAMTWQCVVFVCKRISLVVHMPPFAEVGMRGTSALRWCVMQQRLSVWFGGHALLGCP
jgi:hypothetical protein